MVRWYPCFKNVSIKQHKWLVQVWIKKICLAKLHTRLKTHFFFLMEHCIFHGPLQCLTHFKLTNVNLWHYILFILTVWYSWGTVCSAPRLHTCLALLISSLHFCNNRCLFSSNSMKCCYYKKKKYFGNLNRGLFYKIATLHYISNELNFYCDKQIIRKLYLKWLLLL